ncbi:hypothetical protein SADUNF_Sadunf14G0030300 [Salix dunnii]|uniref:Uncharacterized protein n=1 Tax=Salix dunnii TaxID=1413687 RepID=A0A835JKD4_9ROSI|nr:hypothetical protein SADUNF_Sadunf14G0030300 [Salix dunnii]
MCITPVLLQYGEDDESTDGEGIPFLLDLVEQGEIGDDQGPPCERIEELEGKNCRIPGREDCRDCISKLIATNYRSTSQHQCADDLTDDLWEWGPQAGRSRKISVGLRFAVSSLY